MRCLFFVVFVYAVRCEDGNYYVIQIPHNEPQRTLKVYWNVPTMQCKSKKVVFENLYQKYGIHQNDGDQFRGEMVTILYDPGLFPALLKNETSGKFKFRNGGVPQEGDLDKHLEAFRKDLDFSIPDRNFKGIAIIDFESWRPIYRQNFGVLSPYKDVSYEIERKLHWWWPKSSVEAEAKRRFESSARTFMESTISLARQLRPGGVWGFYGFPYCFNMASNNLVERCANNVPEENDRLSWLWRSSTALYPSIYSPTSLSTNQLAALIRGRVREARRVKRGVVLPYFWYRYRDGGFLTQTDLNAALNELYKSNASGFIIWGSSNDVNTLDKCKKLYNYVQNIFGPTVAKYAKKSFRDEVIDGNNNTTIDHNQIDANNNATIDLNNRTAANDQDMSDEIHTVNKRISTDDIKKDIKEEIVKKFTNYVPINEDNTSEEEEAVLKNNNVLIDLIINSILNREFNSLSNKESTTEYNLINVTNESSLSTKDTVENNNIDENNNFSYKKQSTTDEGIVSTTEPIKITNNDDMQTIDYNNNESHKETTQIDTTTEYNLDNDMLAGRSFIENDFATETTVTNSIDEAKYFNFDANYGIGHFDNINVLSTIDFSSTESTKSTVEVENIFFNEQDEFVNIFTVDDISTTEKILQKDSEKDIFTRINTDIDRNEFEFNVTESEFTNETKFKDIDKEFTEKINQEDVTIESNYNFDTFNESKSIGTSTNSERSEPENINTKSNPKENNRETTTDYTEKTLTSTEDYAVFVETTVTSTISTVNDESKSSIENSTAIVNSQETMNYANFDETIAASISADSKKPIENSTAIVNSQEMKDYIIFKESTGTTIASPKADTKISTATSTELAMNNNNTINYANLDETTATSIASPKPDTKSSTEDSTEIVKNSHETINYANFDETTATSITSPKPDTKSSTENSTEIVKNSHETINYNNFDETTATSIASSKAESQSSTEDSTAVSATEDKVVVYVL